MIVKIHNKVWKIIELPDNEMDKAWGWCYFKDHLIEIDEGIKNKKRLDTLIHELTHAIFPKLPHDKVYDTARVITEVLWKDGWRKNKS